jgi:hypothetical protein
MKSYVDHTGRQISRDGAFLMRLAQIGPKTGSNGEILAIDPDYARNSTIASSN